MRTGFLALCARKPAPKRECHPKNEKTLLVRGALVLEATPGFGPGVEVLQTFALPLGYVAVFVCLNIIAEVLGFVNPFLSNFLKDAFSLEKMGVMW